METLKPCPPWINRGGWILAIVGVGILIGMFGSASASICEDDTNQGEESYTSYFQTQTFAGESTTQAGGGIFLDGIKFYQIENFDYFNALVYNGYYGSGFGGGCHGELDINIFNMSPVKNNSWQTIKGYIGSTFIGSGILSYQIDNNNHIMVRVGFDTWDRGSYTGSQTVKIVRDNISQFALHLGRTDLAYYRYGTLNWSTAKTAHFSNVGGTVRWGAEGAECIGESYSDQVEDTLYWNVEYNRTEHFGYDQFEINKDPDGRAFMTGVEIAQTEDGDVWNVVSNSTSIYDDLVQVSPLINRLRLIEPLSGYSVERFFGCDRVVGEDTCRWQIKVNNILTYNVIGPATFRIWENNGSVNTYTLPGGIGWVNITRDKHYTWNASVPGYDTSVNNDGIPYDDGATCTDGYSGGTLYSNLYPSVGTVTNTTVSFLAIDGDRLDPLSGYVLSGVTVTVYDHGTKITNDYGTVKWTDFPTNGTWSYAMSKAGYDTFNGNFTLSGDSYKSIQVPLYAKRLTIVPTVTNTIDIRSRAEKADAAKNIWYDNAEGLSALLFIAVVVGIMDKIGGRRGRKK